MVAISNGYSGEWERAEKVMFATPSSILVTGVGVVTFLAFRKCTSLIFLLRCVSVFFFSNLPFGEELCVTSIAARPRLLTPAFMTALTCSITYTATHPEKVPPFTALCLVHCAHVQPRLPIFCITRLFPSGTPHRQKETSAPSGMPFGVPSRRLLVSTNKV